MRVLHEVVHHGRKSIQGERIVALPSGVRLRAHVERDSYDFQSLAVVSILTGERGWQPLAYLPIGVMAVFPYSYTQDREVWEHAMREDLTALIELGRTVMS